MGYKILLADDSVTVQKIITLTFSDEGVDVLTVNNGDEAVNRLQYMRPALVMADVSIPGKNGYEICEFIKSHPELKNTPVILLVPAFEPFDEGKARSVGADHFLTKPFQSIRTLISTVKSLIEPGGKPVVPNVMEDREQRPEVESGADDFLDLGDLEVPAQSSRIETTDYFSASLTDVEQSAVGKNSTGGKIAEDLDHVLDLDDVLSDVWVEPATRPMKSDIVERVKPVDGSQPLQFTLPQTVIDEIVDRVAARVTERVTEILNRELTRRVASEIAEIIKQQQVTGKAAYQESDSLLELDEV